MPTPKLSATASMMPATVLKPESTEKDCRSASQPDAPVVRLLQVIKQRMAQKVFWFEGSGARDRDGRSARCVARQVRGHDMTRPGDCPWAAEARSSNPFGYRGNRRRARRAAIRHAHSESAG